MTSQNRLVTFHHWPQSRAAGVRILLEELHAEYDLHVVDLGKNEQRQSAYLAINPMGKVPAIEHNGALITEQAAIYMYLAELYPESKLSPPVGDPLRGPYLRWMVFYGSCFEPATTDKAMQRDAGPASRSGYGSFEDVMRTVQNQLKQAHPWLLGERFTAADVLWGCALNWMAMFKLIPETPELRAYIDRFNARPATQRAAQLDKELMIEVAAH